MNNITPTNKKTLLNAELIMLESKSNRQISLLLHRENKYINGRLIELFEKWRDINIDIDNNNNQSYDIFTKSIIILKNYKDTTENKIKELKTLFGELFILHKTDGAFIADFTAELFIM